jgi:hypothetical protein
METDQEMGAEIAIRDYFAEEAYLAASAIYQIENIVFIEWEGLYTTEENSWVNNTNYHLKF